MPFPVLGPPPYFRSLEHYRQHTSAMYEGGLLRHEDEVFWDVRISSHLPTLEVRAMDVPATAADAAALAAIVRALVVVASTRVREGNPGPPVFGELLRAAYWRAEPVGHGRLRVGKSGAGHRRPPNVVGSGWVGLR
ncbi:glutamate-cysteine ligase family protein [Streptomyces abikoensis]|uniref:glutamate-cysteine ligase family protein n=1 Tax=Streptomyces abikoensis TaxID=97398 RepID=UPI0033D75510